MKTRRAKMARRLRGCIFKPQNPKDGQQAQKIENRRKDLPLESSHGSWPC